MTHRLYYYQLVWTLAHWPIFHAQTRDAILRYISPPPHCVCIHNRTCRINWRHASATVTSCPFYFRVTHTHTNWTRPSVANGLDAKCQQGHKSRAAGQPNNNKVSTVPTDFFQSGSEPGAHIVCEMFPHGKEKKDTTKKSKLFPLSSLNIPVRCIRSRLRNGIVNGKKSGNKKGNAKEER